MKNILLILLFVPTLFLFNCKSGETASPTSKSALFEIYVATEIYGGDKAIKVIKKYGLDKRENLMKYYQALRTLSTNEDEWKAFLKRVEIEREKYSASRMTKKK